MVCTDHTCFNAVGNLQSLIASNYVFKIKTALHDVCDYNILCQRDKPQHEKKVKNENQWQKMAGSIPNHKIKPYYWGQTYKNTLKLFGKSEKYQSRIIITKPPVLPPLYVDLMMLLFTKKKSRTSIKSTDFRHKIYFYISIDSHKSHIPGYIKKNNNNIMPYPVVV